MPKAFELLNIPFGLYGTFIHFKSINLQYFAIFLDNDIKKFREKNGLTKQHGLRLGNY